MPELKTYDLFISHAWKYGEHYDRLVSLLANAPYFSFRNYSAPEQKPLVPAGMTITDSQLRAAIQGKIRPVNAVLVISGMYAAHREWIQFEINTAVQMNKPIIGIRPWGSEVTPYAVTSVAREIVGWNTDSIVKAIRWHSL